jgi:hypothetical protein
MNAAQRIPRPRRMGGESGLREGQSLQVRFEGEKLWWELCWAPRLGHVAFRSGAVAPSASARSSPFLSLDPSVYTGCTRPAHARGLTLAHVPYLAPFAPARCPYLCACSATRCTLARPQRTSRRSLARGTASICPYLTKGGWCIFVRIGEPSLVVPRASAWSVSTAHSH